VRVRRVRIDDGELVAESGVEEFMVGLSRLDGDDTIWLYAGAGRGQQIEVDLRDVARLAALIERVRADAEDGPLSSRRPPGSPV